MWMEFPNDSSLFDIDTQFMIGSGILFAPKLAQPTSFLKYNQIQIITFFLPEGAVWFDYQQKTKNPQTGIW